MKTIELTQGKVALVDDEDYEFLSQWKWYAFNPKNVLWYAVRTINKEGKLIRMHREVMKLTNSMPLVDHKDRNGLNNQKYNLRICNHSQNGANQRPKINSTSKFMGVCLHKTSKKYISKNGEIRIYKSSSYWHAQIKADGKQINLGHFINEIDAAKAYNNAAIKYHGEFANLNVIDNE